MKIDLDIDESYEEISISIKAPYMTQEVSELIDKLKVERNFIGMKQDVAYILNPDSVFLFYCEGRKVLCDALDGTYEIKEKLYEIEEKIKHLPFVRVSKSAIVNIKKIKSIEMSFGNSIMINFVNGRKEGISRRYVADVKARIGIGGKKIWNT